jgi:hypothetical protein
MRKMLFAVAAFAAMAVTPVQAEEMSTTTPELALPEADSTTALPRSTVTEIAPLALPEPEMEAIAPFKRCSDRETVYLTN